MANFRQIQDERIRQLAETLKRNGLAASETEAINMATSMAKTESRVTEHFDLTKQEATMNTGGRKIGQTNPTTQVVEQTQQTSQPTSSWEKEEKAPEAAHSSPAPHHSNQALAAAISAVKEVYQEPQRINFDEETPQEHTKTNQQEPTPQVEEEVQVERTQEAPRVVENTLDQETETTTPQQQEQREPTQEPTPQVEEEAQVERTQEVFEKPPARDLSSYAESRIDLSAIFSASK